MPDESRLDLSFSSTGAGWSEARLFVDDAESVLRMSHIFGHPDDAIAEATNALIEGATSTRFQWFNEPGTHVFQLVRLDSSPRLACEYAEYREDLFKSSWPPAEAPLVRIPFVTNLEYWVELVWWSLARRRALSAYSSYPHRDKASCRELHLIDAHRARRHRKQ